MWRQEYWALSVKCPPRACVLDTHCQTGSAVLEASGTFKSWGLVEGSRPSGCVFSMLHLVPHPLLAFCFLSSMRPSTSSACSPTVIFCPDVSWGQVTMDWTIWNQEPEQITLPWNCSHQVFCQVMEKQLIQGSWCQFPARSQMASERPVWATGEMVQQRKHEALSLDPLLVSFWSPW